jgi:hypothetical protein
MSNYIVSAPNKWYWIVSWGRKGSGNGSQGHVRGNFFHITLLKNNCNLEIVKKIMGHFEL